MKKFFVHKTFIGLILLSVLTIGCSQKSDEQLPPPLVESHPDKTKADLKFQDICEKEFKLTVIPFEFENTRLMYMPVEYNILDYSVTADGPIDPLDPKVQEKKIKTIKKDKSKEQLNILYNRTVLEKGTFQIKVHIEKKINYEQKSLGYQAAYTQEYVQLLRNVYGALSRAYFDVEPLPDSGDEDIWVEKALGDIDFKGVKKNKTHKKLVHSYVKTKKIPDFFVLVFMNVKKGIGTKGIFYFPDFKRAMSNPPSMPYEEFVKRYIMVTLGKESYIDDKEGKTFAKGDIHWSDFLSQQIENRIKIKYTRSDFPPGEDTLEEILKIAATTMYYYKFDTFHTIEVHDLATGKSRKIDKNQIKNYLIE